MKSDYLYIFGFVIIVVGALLLIISGFTGNYGVSVIVFPIPFIFTFGKPASLVSALTLIVGIIMLILFLIYIIVIIHYRHTG